jgi:hypothetical protein
LGVPQKIKDMNRYYPSVIGETTENELVELMDNISFVDFTKPTNVRELKEYFSQVME